MAPGRMLDVAAGAALVWSAQRARKRAVSASEEAVFRRINSLPDTIHPVAWAVMQAGSLGAVHVASGLLARRRGPNPAVRCAAVGTLVWGGVKLVKPWVGRGRPDRHLCDVKVRGSAQTGLGYPSGHAAVATTMALVAVPPGRARHIALGVAATTGLARIYVGAHLPHDVLGGVAIGLLTGHAVRRMVR